MSSAEGTTGSIAHSGMTAEEQALFEELEREAGGAEATATTIKLDTVEVDDVRPTTQAQAAKPQREQSGAAPSPARAEPRRREPELG